MTDITRTSKDKLPLPEWVLERFENCVRIAREKELPADRDGWLEDAAYFREVLVILNERVTHEPKPPHLREPPHCSSCSCPPYDPVALYDAAVQRGLERNRASKEKLTDWLRRWYALKGELRFREAADEIERLQAALSKIVSDGDYTAPEKMTRLAKDALAGAAHEPPVAPMPHDELTALCKRFVLEGYNGDYLENDGFDLAREVEGLTLNRCGAMQPPASEPEPDESDADTCRLAFQEWANKLDLCLDEIFMSSEGVPERPYEDNDTNQFWRAWLASWKAKRPAPPPGPGEFKMGESVRVGPFHNGEYSKVMKITGAKYYCDYEYGPYSADLIVRATSTKHSEHQS